MKRKLRSVFKDTVIDTFQQFKTAELPTAASSLAYTTILSVIPLLAVTFSVFKAFGGLENIYGTIEPFIFENLAEGSDEKTLEMIKSFVGNIHSAALGLSGLVGLLITSMSMLSSVETSINKVWKAPQKRGVFHRVSLYWSFLTLGPIALSVAVAWATSLNVPLSKVLPSGTPFFFILLGIFYGMYRYVPHRPVYWKSALIAAFFTTCTWIIAKLGYGIYVRHFVGYGKIYGSLAAIPIFLVWVYLAWLVILMGAALSAALERHYLKGEAEDAEAKSLQPKT